MGNRSSITNSNSKSGYLVKHEPQSKRRHYVILTHHTLNLYEDESSDYSTECIELNEFANVTLLPIGKSDRFQLQLMKHDAENNLTFIAPAMDATDWFCKIKCAMSNKNNINMENKMEEETFDEYDSHDCYIGSHECKFEPYSYKKNNKTFYYQNICAGSELFKSKSCEEIRFEDQFKRIAVIDNGLDQQQIEEMKHELNEKNEKLLRLQMKVLQMENEKLKQEKSEAINIAERNKQKAAEEEKNAMEKDKVIETMKKNSKYITIWQWKENDGRLISYDTKTSETIEQLAVNDMFPLKSKKNNQFYRITKKSETTAIQINTKTNKKREVIRKKQAVDELLFEKKQLEEKAEDIGYIIKWQWNETAAEKKKAHWNSYDEEISKKIEALDINQSLQFKCSVNGQTYKITKQSKTIAIQINVVSKVKRKCRRFREKIENIMVEAEKYKLKAEEESKKVEEKQSEYDVLKGKVGYKIVWEIQLNNKQWKPCSGGLSAKIEKLKIGEIYKFDEYIVMRISKNGAVQSLVSNTFKRWSCRRKEKASGLNQIEYPTWWFQGKSKSGYIGVERIDLIQTSELEKIFDDTAKLYEVRQIEAVKNPLLWEKFSHEKKSMLKALGQNKLHEKYLFHGTRTEDVMDSVMLQGWRKEFNKKAKYGKGTYFSSKANISIPYSAKSSQYPGEYKMILAKVILGESALGNSGYDLTSWPKKSNGLLMDSLVNDKKNPCIFVIHENYRAYPMYIIHFARKVTSFNHKQPK